MAWFGPKDKNAPLTTRLYQVSYDPAAPLQGSELDRLVRWWRNLPQHGGIGGKETEASPDHEQITEEYRRLDDIRALIIRIMDLAADQDAFSIEHRAHLQRQMQEERMIADVTLSPASSDQACPLRDYVEISLPQSYTQGLGLSALEELDDALRSAATGRRPFAALRRCRFCRSVFIAGRPDQIRCSRRCNDRASSARFFAKMDKCKAKGLPPGEGLPR